MAKKQEKKTPKKIESPPVKEKSSETVKSNMQLDLLRKISNTIAPQGGERIIEILYKKKNVNEFLISKKLNLTINQTRNILYKLLDSGLVKFIRKKDKKKGGWYTYFWTLNVRKSLELLKNKIIVKIEEIDKDSTKRKKERFYYSPGANIEYTEEEALEHNFICPETGEVLELKENSELIDHLDIELSKLKLIVEDLSIEIEELEKKEKKSKERKMKEEQKKKEAERKAKRAKMKKLREKEAKKSGKKPTKKKAKAKAKKKPKTKPKKKAKPKKQTAKKKRK